MMNQLAAFEDARLNASLVTILGLEQETLSARPAEKLRGWSPIPVGLRSSRKASAAVAASLAAMTCGFVALYLHGNSIDRLGHRDGATTVLRDETPALASPRDGRSPVPSQPPVLSGSASAPSPDGLASSMPVPPKAPRISAEGARLADTPSRPETLRQVKTIRPARLHPEAIAPSIEPIPASIDAPRFMAAAQPPADMSDTDMAVAKPARRSMDAVAVGEDSPSRAEARRTSVSAIRALRRQW
jgi:hypothetical protein